MPRTLTIGDNTFEIKMIANPGDCVELQLRTYEIDEDTAPDDERGATVADGWTMLDDDQLREIFNWIGAYLHGA